MVTVDDEFVEFYDALLEECVGVSKQKYMTSLGCCSAAGKLAMHECSHAADSKAGLLPHQRARSM